MLYGNKLVYAYEDIDEREEGKVVTKKLDLTFSPMTFVNYQNYTGKDFMADFMAINLNMANKIRPELEEKIKKGEELTYEDITEERSIVDDISNIIAKIDTRNNVKKDDIVTVSLDLAHAHLFDKDTEVTITARDEGDKAHVEELQVKAVKDRELRIALEAEKKRIEDEKLVKKLSKSRKGRAQLEAMKEEAEVEASEEAIEE
jgi:chorismate mutase